jgi:hypothetical protein
MSSSPLPSFLLHDVNCVSLCSVLSLKSCVRELDMELYLCFFSSLRCVFRSVFAAPCPAALDPFAFFLLSRPLPMAVVLGLSAAGAAASKGHPRSVDQRSIRACVGH